MLVSCRHILPQELGVQHVEAEIHFVDLLQSGRAVILYLHGNSGTRYTGVFCSIIVRLWKHKFLYFWLFYYLCCALIHCIGIESVSWANYTAH